MTDRPTTARPLIPALIAAVFTPFLARIPGALLHGADWFWSYLPSVAGVVFIAAFAAIPGLALFALARALPDARLGFRLALGAMVVALLALHGSLDLASDSTAAVALVVFPVLAIFPMAAGFAIGWMIERSHAS